MTQRPGEVTPLSGSTRTASGVSPTGDRHQAGTDPRRRRRRRPRPPHPAGLAMGTLFAVVAMTPSLLPRDWLYQGLVSGISGALGYGVGVALARVLRFVPAWRRLVSAARGRVPPALAPHLLPVLGLLAAVAVVVMLVVGARWQRAMTAAIGMPPPSTLDWLRAGPLLVLIAAAFVLAARGVWWVSRHLDALLEQRLRWPHAVASVVATVLVLGGVVLVNDVLLQRALGAADAAFAARNDRDHPGVERPSAAERSGAPGSLVAWASLGREGRRFVAGGPSTDDLRTAAPDAAPTTPVRVYVGIENADTPRERADLAVEELERTGAFERQVLLLVTTTGSGWVNEAAVEPLELMYAGDTAAVATQYSYLPSWLSFLFDRARVSEESQALATAVEAHLARLPADERPLLLAYGESLGSYGSETAFPSLADIRARTDGVLWVGPPDANAVWHALVERRDPGTPAVAPVYASGLLVRFAGDAAQITTPTTPWDQPRALYLQHADDPVVWWSPDVVLSAPDRLREQPADTDRPAMRWFPVVTFWQLTFDLLNAKSVPDGYGHNYDGLVLDGWVGVVPPDGWTAADTARVRAVLAE
ncbi:alpha/beta hydrolase [Cellulomonas xiejunii]|uniref:Alpha/beta hydrolase n=1 Tax=Cellulomonas xiejunii TaxID=2968083 RepID=A0ABY5KMN2_9CELL|nr:alpha/beta hydrolase [Cellulomonas xiejunii]MCC2321174.1 alpha/beta hydrolase [Cellulomonas xiejunii]UUI71764.1 alpha/beta hydrolase [Cellulomonas xiejunii]